MYVVIRRTKLGGSAGEGIQRTRGRIVPLVEGRPGFRGYCASVTERGEAAVSVGVFDGKDTAMDAHGRARQRVESSMRDFMPEEPEVVAGETVFDSTAHPQERTEDRQRSLLVVLRDYRGLPGQAGTMHSAASERTLPAVTDAPGFHASRDEADPDRAVSFPCSTAARTPCARTSASSGPCAGSWARWPTGHRRSQ